MEVGKWGVTAYEYRVSFGGDEYVVELVLTVYITW